MKKFSVSIAKQHATSVSLEEEFYQQLLLLAKEQKIPLNTLITQIDSSRDTQNLSSALRVYVLNALLNKLKNLK